MSETGEHPERALVRQAIEGKLTDVAVATNPLAIALGMRLVEAREGYVKAAYRVPDGFTQGNGVVQGGIVSAMLDFGMVFAAFSKVSADATVATISQTTNYLRAALVGHLVVEAEVERAGKTLVNARAVLMDGDGKLLASASAPLAVIHHRKH